MIRIVTVGFHNPPGLVDLLNSLQKHWRVPGEFVLFDNGGTRETAERWSSEHPEKTFRVHIKGDGKNCGFGAAVNRSAEFDSGESWSHLLLLNPDALLASDVTSAEITRLKSLRGIVGLRVFDDREKKIRQPSARHFPSWFTSISGREGLLSKVWPGNPWTKRYLAADLDPTAETKVDWVSGCALWVSREDWRRLGGFDESYFLYVEDVDLGRKAQKLGLPVTYSPLVDVIHESRGSARKAPFKSDYYHHLGMWVYHVKWSGPLGLVAGPFVFLGIWARFLFRRIANR